MADVSYALQKVVTDGTGFTAQGLGRPSAGKTGTTNDGLSAWYVGYTPQMSTAVVLFRNDKQGNPISLDGVGGLATVTGGSYPARIWTEMMKAALEGTEVIPFPKPANIGGQPSSIAEALRLADPDAVGDAFAHTVADGHPRPRRPRRRTPRHRLRLRRRRTRERRILAVVLSRQGG